MLSPTLSCPQGTCPGPAHHLSSIPSGGMGRSGQAGASAQHTNVQLPVQGYAAVLAAGTRTTAKMESPGWAGAGQPREVSFNTKKF